MNKLIIDATNGTILNMNDCYIVDAELLGDDIVLSDREVQDLANEHGISVAKMAQDTGFGDNAYRFGVSYSPLSIRDEAITWLEGQLYIPSDDAYEAIKWARDEATTEQLQAIGEFVLCGDAVWDGFRENLEEGIVWGYQNQRKN